MIWVPREGHLHWQLIPLNKYCLAQSSTDLFLQDLITPATPKRKSRMGMKPHHPAFPKGAEGFLAFGIWVPSWPVSRTVLASGIDSVSCSYW